MTSAVWVAAAHGAAPVAPGLPLDERVWRFAGKMHPLSVHFPIALLLVGAMCEFVRRRKGSFRPGAAARVCVILGGLSAAVVAAMGWSNAEVAGHTGSRASILEWHRWLGIGVACLGVLAASLTVLADRVDRRPTLTLFRLAVVSSALAVGAAGHFGGSLTYGPDYVSEALSDLGVFRRAVISAAVQETADGPAVDFTLEVAPILGKRCQSCHAGEKPESGLRVDSREALLRGGTSGKPAVVPGDPNTSRLIRLVSGHEPSKLMPPKGIPLTDAEVATLRRWIAQGATWSDRPDLHWHWAYRPPVRPNPPPVHDTNWPRNPIDHFVLARLDSEELSPAPEADRATLIRRVSLDLIGLPPTPEEVGAFEADESPVAYERVVDRLLASPRYGERWARPWLDLARYADTHGYEKDARRVMWPYRDWVIQALNRDMPFDRFTIEQIAGDMLPAPTLEQVVATGFHRNTQINEEGGTDPEEFRLEAVLDRVNTTASVWLGSTIGCAQCHDHKFDPFSQKDYYRLVAFFNQDAPDALPINDTATETRAGGPMVDVPAMGRYDELERAQLALREAREAFRRGVDDLSERRHSWEAEPNPLAATWDVLVPSSMIGTGGVALAAQPDGSILAGGGNPDRSSYTLTYSCESESVLGALRIEVLPEPSSPSKGLGRTEHGNFVLSEVRAEVVGPGDGSRVIRLESASADHWHASMDAGDDWSPALVIDGREDGRGWTVHPDYQRPHEIVVRLTEAERIEAGQSIRVTLVQNWGSKHTVARFRVGFSPDSKVPLPVPTHVRAALNTPSDQRTAEQTQLIVGFHASVALEMAELRRRVAETERRVSDLVSARAMVMGKHGSTRKTHVFNRGSFMSPGAEVSPGVPLVLASASCEAQSEDRVGLAKWLVDPGNPLPARVQTNRLWATIFGRGLVETEEDFGTQGDPPSHPELLDWLATEFVRLGWSQKELVRTIVTSATYRQSSVVSTDHLQRDPHNRLLARGPRFRLDAEMIRDQALAAAGLLSGKIGGPSVFPPQPEGTWTMIYNNDRWITSEGEDRHRRGLYTFWRRTAPYPTFVGFDAPSREISCVRRPRTNTPLQALATLNDPAFVESASALARRMMSEGGGEPAGRVERGFRLCLARRPTDAERELLVGLFVRRRAEFELDRAAAKMLTAANSVPSAAEGTEAETAAWTVVANVMLNLDETLTRN
ncbi:MAG: DUF1553 domain-containing protein [Phycisphaerae bacterium]|nr:DUF1553 domain-containing protein [Phycisphaerae bacterium]